MPVVRDSARQADDRHSRHRPPDPRALWGLRRVYRPGSSTRRPVVLLLDLVPAGSVAGSQLFFLLRPDPPERVRLMATIDQLNARHGRDRVRFAASGLERG